MTAILPDSAQVKRLDSGEAYVSTVKPGIELLGYNVAEHRLEVIKVDSVEPLDPRPSMAIMLKMFRWTRFFCDTEAYAPNGPEPLRNLRPMYLGYCLVNPGRMVSKEVVDFQDLPEEPGRRIRWSGAAYLWSEGLLVGTT